MRSWTKSETMSNATQWHAITLAHMAMAVRADIPTFEGAKRMKIGRDVVLAVTKIEVAI